MVVGAMYKIILISIFMPFILFNIIFEIDVHTESTKAGHPTNKCPEADGVTLRVSFNCGSQRNWMNFMVPR